MCSVRHICLSGITLRRLLVCLGLVLVGGCGPGEPSTGSAENAGDSATGTSHHQSAGVADESDRPDAGKPKNRGEDSRPEGSAAEFSAKTSPAEAGRSSQRKPAQGAGSPLAPPRPEFWLDEAELRELGVELFESPRLRLHVDQVRPAERIELAELPRMMDQFFQWLEANYPELLPAAEPEVPVWQLNGFIMREPALFLQAGLLPEELADMNHGKDLGENLWLIDPPTALYRRHLLLHEALHCVMNARPHQWPIWYLEGMAELAAVHRKQPSGQVRFGLFPDDAYSEGGFGRLQLLREEVAAGRIRLLQQIRELNESNFYPHKTSYAWSWAVCYFLTEHPQTSREFRELTKMRRESEFNHRFREMLQAGGAELQADWVVFLHNLVPGYQFSSSLITWETPPGRQDENLKPVPATGETIPVQVDRHWQRSGLQVQAGSAYRITGEGRYVVAREPVPWECEPQGVTIEYVSGRPRGELQMVFFPAESSSTERALAFSQVVPVGRELVWQAPEAGELFFRINDWCSSWLENTGTLQVTVQPEP